jgi:hypothetical protein
MIGNNSMRMAAAMAALFAAGGISAGPRPGAGALRARSREQALREDNAVLPPPAGSSRQVQRAVMRRRAKALPGGGDWRPAFNAMREVARG